MNNWIKESIFYHIYPLGLCDAPMSNDFISPAIHRLNIIYDWIPHLIELGVNALYLGPVFESESHGYDIIDYYHVDRRLGNNDTLKCLIDKLHRNGIKVILDAVFNHTSRHFFAFKGLLAKGQNSEYKDWYYGVDFSGRSPYGDSFQYHSWSGHYNLAKLNLDNPQVRHHLLEAVRRWVTEFNIDGLRLDAADVMSHSFMGELDQFCKSINPDFWVMGEVVHGDYSIWANIIDSTTNYEVYKGLYSSHNDNNYFEIAYSFNRQFGDYGIYKDLSLYNFADNHDVNRLASTIHDNNHIFSVYAMLFTMTGVPSIYYGSEWGIEGIKSTGSDAPLRPAIDINNLKVNIHGLREWITKLISIRKGSDALKYGSYSQLFINHKQFAFERINGKDNIIAIFNSQDSFTNITLDKDGSYLDLITGEKRFYSSNCRLNVEVPPYSSLILKKV